MLPVANTMYSFMLVDDESEIREGIRDNIPWEELGFRFVGACSNGKEALELAEQVRPDVVMTDINMPFMDGLALSEQLLSLLPATKVLIISGYDDFEYARRALKLQVHDFIVKPVTPSELKTILSKLKSKMDEERSARDDIERIQSQLAESLPLLRERFLHRLLAGVNKKEDGIDLAERLRYFNLPIPSSSSFYISLVLDYQVRRNGRNFDLDLIAERNAVEAALSEASNPSLVFLDAEERVVVLLWSQKAPYLYRESLKAAETIREMLARSGMGMLTIGLGEAVEDLYMIPRSYQDALHALTFGLLRGKTEVVAYRELVGKIAHEAENIPSFSKAISSALRTSDMDEAKKQIHEMSSYFKKTPLSPETYKSQLRFSLAAIVQTIDELEIPLEGVFPDGQDPFEDLRDLKTLDEAELWFFSLAKRIIEYLKSRQENFALSKAREALDFMENNYAQSDLSLPTLCKELYISTSYFSSIFKKLQGKTFVEQLTEIRINKAKELLRTSNMKTYEIAEKVGYKDAHYFSMSFRKYAGETPTEWREASKPHG
ncbi:response regulator [Treponema sp.]